MCTAPDGPLDTALPPTLTQAQLGIWLGHQRATNPSIYNAAQSIRFVGAVDHAALRAALQQTLSEARALHVAFPEVQGAPALRASTPDLTVTDVALGARALAEYARAEARRPLDIARGQLYRHQLLTLSDGSHAWLHIAHHIALDGYGFNLLTRRVAEVYSCITRGAPLTPCPFTDLHGVLDDERADAAPRDDGAARRDLARDFWRAELGASSGVTWPRLATARTETGLAHPLRVHASVSAEERAALDDACRAAGVAWVDLVLALIAAQVARRSGRAELVLGLPVMLRMGTRALRTPCMAMNIAPLPVAFTSTPETLLDVARRLRAALTRQRPHHAYRYEQLRLDRAQQAGSLFGPVVNVMPFDFPVRFGDCATELLEIAAGPVEDLAVGISPRDGALQLTIDGHPDFFTEDALRDLGRELLSDLRAWLAAPQAPVDLAPAPTQSRLDGPPAPAACWPPQALAEHAHARPTALALRESPDEGARCWTYAELHDAVRSTAGWLEAAGCRPGDLVALELPRSAHAVVLLHAVLWLGAGYVALDPSHPPARRQQVLATARPRLFIHAEAGSDLTCPVPTRAVAAPASLYPGPFCERAPAPADAPRAATSPAYVVFTSGSSGEPKGVTVSAGALAHFAAAARSTYGFTATDRVLQFAPLTFDASVEELFVTAAAGAALVVRDDEMLDSVEAFISAVDRAQLTVLDLPTAYWHELVRALELQALRLPRSVRAVIIGGEAALPERVATFRRLAPQVRLLNTYGPSESTVVATCAELGAGELPALPSTASMPIGQPLPGVTALLLSPGGHAPVAPTQAGELCLLGPTLASGYLGREDLTRERFTDLPGFGVAYRTGDLAALIDGQLVFCGRVDDELKISGYRVAPAEVERALCRHSEVSAAVVWGETTAETGPRLRASVECATPTLDAGALKAFLQQQLPAPMVPTRIEIAAALPRTSSGKLDRAALRRSAAAAAAAAAEPGARPERCSTARSATLTPAQAQVAEIWRALLGVDDVAPSADFFALGGNSLQVLQLANRLSELGHAVRVAELFRNPTLAAQAQLFERVDVSATAPHSAAPNSAAPFAPRPLSLRLAGPAASAQALAPRLLLTGATGFVGLHLLLSWLERSPHRVTCVVRGPSAQSARERLLQCARAQGASLDPYVERIDVLCAALDSAALDSDALDSDAGLFEQLPPHTHVLHCAAQVSLTRDYDSLFAPNVAATQALLELASQWRAEFHFVSTIATLPAEHPAGAAGETFYPQHSALRDGYQRSKWHAEQLCEQAAATGVATAVYRLGRVVGARRRPSVNPADLLWRIARASTNVGLWPSLDFEEPWSPVDTLADSMVQLLLAGSARAPGAVYHLLQDGTVSPRRVREALQREGYALATVAPREWLDAIRAHGDQEI